jgi:translation initiation factor 1
MTDKNRKLVYSTDPTASTEDVNPPARRAAASDKKPKRPTSGVRVALERAGRGGKSVSVITGIGGSEASRAELLKQLKSKLGTGGALKGDTLEIQGDQRDKLVILLNELGYAAKRAGG